MSLIFWNDTAKVLQDRVNFGHSFTNIAILVELLPQEPYGLTNGNGWGIFK